MGAKTCFFIKQQDGLVSVRDFKPIAFTCDLGLEYECPYPGSECPRHKMNEAWRLKNLQD